MPTKEKISIYYTYAGLSNNPKAYIVQVLRTFDQTGY